MAAGRSDEVVVDVSHTGRKRPRSTVEISSVDGAAPAEGSLACGVVVSSVEMDLPLDIVHEILVRLPIKTLIRFRCVSKPWSSLISCPPFQEDHYKRSQKNPLLLIARNEWDMDDRLSGFHLYTYNKECDLRNKFTISVPYLFNSIKSCRGLVCIAHDIQRIIRICNPSTNEIIALPSASPGYHVCVGFGYVASTKEFKLVRFFCGPHFDSKLNKKEIYCEVLTLGTSDWRKAKSAPYYIGDDAPFVQGAIHLCPLVINTPKVDYSIAAFDIETEEYRRIRVPECYCGEGATAEWEMPGLTEIGGLLCLSMHAWFVPSQLQLWLLWDYNNGEWVKYNIDLSPINPYICRYLPISIMGDMGVLLNIGMKAKLKRNFLYMDNTQDKILGENAPSGSVVHVQNNATIFWEVEQHYFGMVTLHVESLFGIGK